MTTPNFEPAIQSTRKARDNAAHAARVAGTLGIPSLQEQLDQLAASYDKLLADLLALQSDMRLQADERR